MVTAIIGAMDIEVQTLCLAFEAQPTETVGVYMGKSGENTVIVCKCGVGKVNAAALTQRIIDKYSPEIIINTGTAGALTSRSDICDIIIGEKAAYHDFHPLSIVENMLGDRYIHADEELVKKARKACIANGIPSLIGTVVTGDCFVETIAQRERIFENFPDALCTEMEGAAIAHVCFINKVPFVVIRAVSDFAADEAVFEENAERAAESAALISKYIVENN